MTVSYLNVCCIFLWCCKCCSTLLSCNEQMAIGAALVLIQCFTRTVALVGHRYYNSLCHFSVLFQQMWPAQRTENLAVKCTGRINRNGKHVVGCCSKLCHCIPVELCDNVQCRWCASVRCVPSLGFFFMSLVKSGFCLIRRHGCVRKCESHDAASSPQSTVSTLEEEKRISFPGEIYSLMLPIWSNI